jgi:endonuclease YncB( thermonuclease family)
LLFENPGRALLIGLIAASLELCAGASFADDVEDGDTIEIQGQPACLYGIDALELGQTCTDARGKT